MERIVSENAEMAGREREREEWSCRWQRGSAMLNLLRACNHIYICIFAAQIKKFKIGK